MSTIWPIVKRSAGPRLSMRITWTCTFWTHGGGHVLAVRQYNWLTSDAPSAAQATVSLRGYKFGQYLSPIGAGVHFVIKPEERMLVSLEYSQGIEDSRGVYLKLGYAW
jgi:hypothetical protein